MLPVTNIFFRQINQRAKDTSAVRKIETFKWYDPIRWNVCIRTRNRREDEYVVDKIKLLKLISHAFVGLTASRSFLAKTIVGLRRWERTIALISLRVSDQARFSTSSPLRRLHEFTYGNRPVSGGQRTRLRAPIVTHSGWPQINIKGAFSAGVPGTRCLFPGNTNPTIAAAGSASTSRSAP